MSLRPEPEKKINQVVNLLNSVNDDNYEFNNRRVIKLSEEYETTDSLNKNLYLYTQAVAYSNLQKYPEAISFYQKVSPSIIKKYGNFTYIKYWVNFAHTYYMINDYKAALTKLENIENILKDTNDYRSVVEAIIIYLEGNEYNKISALIKNILDNIKNIPGGIFNKFKVYYFFYLNETDDYYNLVLNLKALSKQDLDNLEKHLKFKIKPYLTDMEKQNIDDLKEVVELINKYSMDEIFFQGEIIVDDSKFVVDIEQHPGWFYGEIENIKKCRAAGLTIDELKDHLIETLNVCLNHNDLSGLGIPNKTTLRAMMETELNKNLHKVDNIDDLFQELCF